jgi:glycosyltransferase involved in cell wall biosynthesis
VNGVAGIGGLDRVAKDLAQHLPAQGIDTSIVIPENGVEHHHHHSSSSVQQGPHRFRDWLRCNRPDVISLHGSSDWVVTAAAEFGIPVVETLHGAHSFFDVESWAAERLRSRHVAAFVAVSELVRKQYLRANPDYPPERILTIPNGVAGFSTSSVSRADARARLGLMDQFLFVSLARYSLQKNTFGLVQAFGDLARRNSNVHLLVAGPIQDSSYCRQVLRLRDQLPCADRIHLRGNCEHTAALLAAADAFVLNSFFEGWALASMEALAAGLPVVISDVGGAREQVGRDGTRGIVVDNPLGDPEFMGWPTMSRAAFRGQVNREALVTAMQDVVRKRDYWDKVRGDLQEESLERFSMSRWSSEHARVLARAAGAQAKTFQ